MDDMEIMYVKMLENEVNNSYSYMFDELDEDDILLLWATIEDMDSKDEAYSAVEEYMFNFKIIHESDFISNEDIDELNRELTYQSWQKDHEAWLEYVHGQNGYPDEVPDANEDIDEDMRIEDILGGKR